MVSSQTPTRLYTVAEATAMLPLVRAIARDMVTLGRETAERKERLNGLVSDRAGRDDVYSEELEHIDRELELDAQRLRGYVKELRDLGLIVRDLISGTIDFPIVSQDRTIHGCWRLGEPTVEYWHEVDADCDQRKPLPVDRAGKPPSSTTIPFG